MRFIVEVADELNGSHIFSPTKDRLRGRWDFANTAHRTLDAESLRKMAREVKVIPGIHVAVDDERMEGVIFDPLSGDSESSKALWEKIERIVKEHKAEFGSDMRPIPTKKQVLSYDDVKEWLWEMRCIVEAKQGVLASGSDTLPSFDEISTRPGRRRRDPLNSGQQTGTGKQGEDRLQKWTDQVPLPKKDKATVGA